MPAIEAVKGTRDLLPPLGPLWEWILETHRAVSSRFGYRFLDAPVLEHTELFVRGVGTGTDIVDKEMYSLQRGDLSLTLRPEGTAGALRAVLSSWGRLDKEPRPWRVRYAGPMFRADQPQRGRYRQFVQVGVECIGERSPALDVEVIECGWRFFEALGITGLVLQVNSLGEADDRERYRAALVAYYRGHLDDLCADCRRRLDINPLRLLDCKRDSGLAEAAPRLQDQLSPESAAYFETVLEGLRAAGIPFTVNHRLVRGLDYYAHTAFEYQHETLHGAQNALGGGGRYDGLAELLGHPPAAGVGYALGVDRIALVCEDLGLGPAPSVPPVLVCSVGEGTELAAAAAARRLREGGMPVVLDAGTRRLDKKLRAAERHGAVVAVIIGDDEAAAGAATVRDLRTRTQERIEGAALVDQVRRLVAEDNG